MKIVSLLVFLTLLYGCSAEDSILMDTPISPLDKKAQVVLTLSVPEVSLPLASRSISDDKAIGDFVLWAFDNNDRFLYQIGTTDKDDKGNNKVVIRGNKIYASLPESETEVTLAIIANNGTVAAPKPQTPKATALTNLKFTFSEALHYIPMYGESIPFIVKEGATPGTIRLTRALAKIELDVSVPFTLESVEVVNVNTEGTVVKSATIQNAEIRRDFISAASGNKWVFYIPEATNVGNNDPNIRTSLLLKGHNEGQKIRYYRLDFIKRFKEASAGIEYRYIHTIERNHRYVFHIEYIVAGAGSETREEARSKEKADNAIIQTSLMTIDDENIRDITTDNEYYLGITWSQIEASKKASGDGKYYTANMSIATNNPVGWNIESPAEVELSVNQWQASKGEDLEKVTSVWIYIENTKAVGDRFTLYVYSGNIRKSVIITIIE